MYKRQVLDTAKAVADGLDLPCVIVPTAASNDAPCTSVAVLYNDAGVVIKALVTKHDPELILVDTELIAQAPERLFACGLGDALSTYFEARACKKNGVKCMARGQVSNTGMMMARLCYDLLIQSGKKALDAVRNHEVNQDLENAVEASIYLSGVGFVNGGLAVAHAVNDGLAYEPQCHGMYHGEKAVSYTHLDVYKSQDQRCQHHASGIEHLHQTAVQRGNGKITAGHERIVGRDGQEKNHAQRSGNGYDKKWLVL